ncbi:MAG: PQQ-like beta-propeller repeat protein [Planctomycetes bacterium]|nr:PQQ-like beta-propeller repeat protein [Planctomycetota bacterium]
MSDITSRSVQPRLRLWPALVFIALQWIFLTAPAWIVPGTVLQFYGMMLGPLIGTLGVLAWLLFASRLRWTDRLLGALWFIALGAMAYTVFHPSFDLFGVFFLALPAVTTAAVLALLVTPFLSWRVRRVTVLVVMVLGWGYYTLVRYEGATGAFDSTLTFRWVASAEDKYQVEIAAGRLGKVQPLEAASVKALALQPGDWPGFRGLHRDGRLTGVKIATDWSQNPPKEIWRHRVGPGWSSFTVVGKHLFTQEQRGDTELVVCYDADTGATIWVHKDAARFAEKIGGPGPRATPTFHEGKLFVQGATGMLNCLDAATGQKIWSRNIAMDSEIKPPDWGFASSPLVVQGVVTVFAGAPGGKSVLAYDATSWTPLWQAGEGQRSYCSLHPARLGGVEQVLVCTDLGLTAFQPTSGDILWNHAWNLEGMQRVVQPTIVSDTDVLLGTGFGLGTRRLRVSKQGSAWETQEVWLSRAISPYFNDLVIDGGHLYGFDGGFFTCVSLEDGKKKWRARGYGAGQVLLLADQNLLLVVTEKGAVALVEATPDEHREIARFQAIEGKTWNHPVVAHGKLFVRNSEEAACFQLPEMRASK